MAEDPRSRNAAGGGSLPLFVFGLIGLGVTCLEGLEPFIELAKYVKLAMEKWTEIVRFPWVYLSGLFQVSVPVYVIDAVNGVLFVVSYILGFRRGERILSGWFSSLARVVVWSSRRPRTKAIGAVLVSGSFCVLLGLLLLSQPISAVFLFGAFALMQSDVGWRAKLGRRLLGTGEAAEEILMSQRWYRQDDTAGQTEGEPAPAYGFAMAFMSWGILAFCGVALALNLVATNSERILQGFDALRCAAGVSCEPDG